MSLQFKGVAGSPEYREFCEQHGINPAVVDTRTLDPLRRDPGACVNCTVTFNNAALAADQREFVEGLCPFSVQPGAPRTFDRVSALYSYRVSVSMGELAQLTNLRDARGQTVVQRIDGPVTGRPA